MHFLSGFVDQVRNASWPSLLFSLGAVAVWSWILIWALRGRQHRCYVRALIIATIYCFVSEYLAIRLGKYHYARMALSLPPLEWPWLTHGLTWLADHHVIPPIIEAGFDKDVPLEVALIEAALLVTIFRVTNLLFPHIAAQGARMGPWRWMWLALPIACLNGLLALNLDAILDPVVSGSFSVEATKRPTDFSGLDLWTWHTTNRFQGHWFGIPLANYTAWFAGLFAFSLAVRIGQDHLIVGPTRFERGKNIVFLFARSVGFLVLLLFTMKFGLDYLLYGSFDPTAPVTSPARQFGVLAGVIALSLVAAGQLWRHWKTDNPFEPVSVAPQSFVFFYCLGALIVGVVYPNHAALVALWVVGVALAALHAWATFRAARRARVPAPGPRTGGPA